MATYVPLSDPSLFIGRNYINGQWLQAASGKTFDVTGQYEMWHLTPHLILEAR